MSNNKVIKGLWIGNSLSVMEQLSIKSFIKNEHEYHLYVYEDVKNIPEKTILKNANKIIPRNQIFKEKEIGSYAAFADIFRYKLLLEKGGYWADTDVVCLRPFNFQSDYVFATEKTENGATMINNNVIKVPVGSEIMRFCYDVSSHRASGNYRWGDLGPNLLNKAVEKFHFGCYVFPYKAFNPINWWDWKDIITSKLSVLVKMRLKMIKQVYAIHLWYSMWIRGNADKEYIYHSKCLYEKLKRKYLGS